MVKSLSPRWISHQRRNFHGSALPCCACSVTSSVCAFCSAISALCRCCIARSSQPWKWMERQHANGRTLVQPRCARLLREGVILHLSKIGRWTHQQVVRFHGILFVASDIILFESWFLLVVCRKDVRINWDDLADYLYLTKDVHFFDSFERNKYHRDPSKMAGGNPLQWAVNWAFWCFYIGKDWSVNRDNDVYLYVCVAELY